MERIQIVNSLMMQLFKLYEDKGKAYYYKQLFSKDDQTFVKNTLEEDTESIAKFLGLDITAARIKLLANQKRSYKPKKKDEVLLLNLKDALTKVQEMSDDFTLVLNEVTDLVTILFRGYETVKFNKKGTKVTKTTKTFEELSSDAQLQKLIDQYHTVLKSNKHELLIVICNFYVDFIKIEPFNKYNDIIGLMLIYTIISKEFQVCRYGSFFKALLPVKDRLDTALIQANYDWEHGLSQTDALVRVIIDVLEQLHREVQGKEHIYSFDIKLNKTNTIESIIMNGPAVFSKNYIRNKAPLASESTINRTLQMLKTQGTIRSLGQGRSATWQRVKDPHEKFNVQQLTLFSEED